MTDYPLTETMLGMFLEWNEDRESTRYTIAVENIFPRGIDADRLVAAVEKSVAAEAIYRARFVESESGVRWTVDDSIEIRVVRIRMSEAEARAKAADFARGFDAFTGPFARFELIETPEACHLLTEFFHLVSDGTSLRRFFDSVERLYSDPGAEAAVPPLGFRDYALAETDGFASPDYAEAKAAATERFSGKSMTVPEPAVRPGAIEQTNNRTVEQYLSEEVSFPRGTIDRFCRENGLVANLFFMGVFARTLALYANEKEVVFWTVNHGRGRWPADGASENAAALKTMAGCFVKTVPVLGTLKGDLDAAEYFRSFRLHRAGVYPFTHFCRDLGIKPGWGFVYQEGTVDCGLTLDGVASQSRRPMSGGAGEMPAVQVFGSEDAFRLEVTCLPGRYDRGFLSGFIARMRVIAENFAAGGSPLRLDRVPVLSPDEKAQALRQAYGGELAYDASQTFIDLFRAQVAARPDATAVVGIDGRLTYGELDAKSDALAAALVAAGVKEGGFVALRLPRRTSFMVAMVAVQKCGAGYVPLDPEYPQDRLDYMIEDSGAPVVIDEEFYAEVERRGGGGQWNSQTSNLQPSTFNLQPASPAYMIYTSGSTGKPKGVVIAQREVVNLIKWFEHDFGVGPGKRNIVLASFSFDASVPDLFTPLACGGEVHILDEETRKDLSAVGEYCVRNHVTGAVASTRMGLALVNAYPELPLEYMMLGGEKLTAFARTPVRMINGYGPTEFTVCSSYHEVDQSRSYDYPIGRAVPNTWTFVVDRLGEPVPPGMRGEIALAGVQLSEGYWHQPEKTAKAFVEMPFSVALGGAAGSRMYLTGDFGRYNGDGELEFLGRLDFQVKLRGFRIEIGEIEHTASTFPGIGAVIALVKNVAGSDHLVLYYTADAAAKAGRQEALRAHLAKTLTPYMVPDFFVELEKMPLTPGGKIDRAALPLPEAESDPVVPAEGEFETKLLAVVAETLKRNDFGVTQDFNRLGLTSLGAMELLVRFKKTLGVKVTMRQLQQHPTVRQLSEFLNGPSAGTAAEKKPAAAAAPAPAVSCPMTENQRGIYTEWLLNPGTVQYNVPAVLKFPGLDPERLAAAAAKVLAAHPAFSVRFVEQDGEIVQSVPAESRWEIPVERLETEPDVGFFTRLVRPFAPQGEPLARARVYSVDCVPGTESNNQTIKQSNNSYLFLDFHHTVFDGYSMGILMRDLGVVLDGGEPEGEEFSVLDAAKRETEYLASAEAEEDLLWFERYIGEAESTKVETSPDAAGRPGESGKAVRRIPAGSIPARCAELGVTPSDYFLTVFTELLRRTGRGSEVLINFVTAGRTDPDTAGTVGMFVKTLPLKGVKDAVTFENAVKLMHENVLDLLDRERTSFAKLSERFGVRPDTLFVFEGGIFELPHGAELIAPPLDTAKAPLSVTVTPGKDDFELGFDYDRSMYADADMERMVTMFANLAAGLLAGGRLDAVPLVPPEEQAKILEAAYGGDLEYDTTRTFLGLFHANVLTRSFATAVVESGSGRSLTYGELDAKSDALAARLVAAGVSPGGFVGIRLPRCADFVVSVIAVQKCGAGYVPMDPEYPAERIAYMVENSGAPVVIDEKFYAEVERRGGGGQWNSQTSNPQPSTFNLQPVSPASPAYMIYTSGSTGRPKGVVIPHRALRNLIAWTIKEYSLSPSSRLGAHPSFSFDASVPDLFAGLAAGGEVHIFTDELRKDLKGMRDYIVEHGLTEITMSTQIGMALIDTYPDLPLNAITMGGEKMMPVSKTKVRIYNGYGPTEFCVCSSFERVDQDRGGDIPIGRAVPNTWSVIVDRYGHLLPFGAAGELALIGPQLADGYWKLPEKTAAVFTAIPFAGSAASGLAGHTRMYRTGDLARYSAEGKLEYLGRLDFQVKLRGFRIEIGEIESVAKAFPGVGSVAAEVREVGGTKHLVLYYEGSVDEAALKASMAEKLTSYMVPDYFVAVAAMPMTPNGKINRRLLKSPSAADSPREFVEPANELEKKIAAVYAAILGLDRCGATDDFFESGGTSLIAIKAVVALQKAGLEVQYGDLFKYKTPRSLAGFVDPSLATAAKDETSEAKGFDFGAYDYTAIDGLLAKTRTDLFGGFVRHSLGDVLLAGATGYLGMHVLRYLLESTSSTVFALVRSKKGVGGLRRIDSQYVYYFGQRVPKRFRDRLVCVEGDITDDDLAEKTPLVHTVVNCAALVKHYVADDLMDRINVQGVENLIALCEKTGARLVQTSTYSIGGTIRADSATGLDERHLYIGQESDNDYIRTKFLAERAVLEATAAGRIRGKVMRLGNLMGRQSDGEFQMNVGANAFINSLKTYRALGAYPLVELARPLEMSPIDRVAEAVCLLATTPDDMTVFHPYNRYALDMGAVIGALNARGLDIDEVSEEDFAAHVDALRNDPARAAELQGILHYAGHLLKNRRMAPVDNAWTTTVLYRLGFRWKPAEDRYLDSFFNMLEGLAVFG